MCGQPLRPGDTDGMVARNLGEVCRLLGRFDEALRHLRVARARPDRPGPRRPDLRP
ncbi:tetratricopeptide repeat protein [Nonomuraea sp. NPDC003560]|uniref:tetratricopeptide repeat protein n=1 Tax=Nonomuraea sp. NPDC003560 TaxID=3364341 RepID=UPI003698E3C4